MLPGQDLQVSNAVDTLVSNHWGFLSAADLGLSTDNPEAIVAVNYTDHTMAISFQGSVNPGDLLLAGLDQGAYFDGLRPLITAALNFSEQANAQHPGEIQNLYITGHSLGGIMADWTALQYGAQIGSTGLNTSIVTFGSPGVNQLQENLDAFLNGISNSDTVAQGILNFGNPDDPFFEGGTIAGFVRDGVPPIEMTLPNVNPYDLNLPPGQFEHYMPLYLASVESITQSVFYDQFIDNPTSHQVIVDTLLNPADQRPINKSHSTNDLFIVGNSDVAANGLPNSNNITGGSGNDWIQGGTGNNVLNGGPGNDILAGGVGNNTFVFNQNFGNDTIVDFHPGDTIQIDHTVFADLSALMAHTADNVSGHTVITADANDSITLNVSTSFLHQHQDAFHLV